MRRIRTQRDSEAIISEADAILQFESEDTKFLKKVEIVKQVLLGRPTKEIADESGFSKRSVEMWVSLADKEGFDSLRSKARTGLAPKLSNAQREEIDNMIMHTTASSHGDYRTPIWNARILKEVIQNEYQVSYSERSCGKLLSESGYQGRKKELTQLWNKGRLGSDEAWARIVSILEEETENNT